MTETVETINGALSHAVATHPDRCFLKIDGQEITARQFEARVARLAGGLADEGIAAGDRVLGMMPNCREMIELWFATVRVGAVWAPVNIEFRGAVLGNVLATTRPSLCVCGPEFAPELESALRDTGQAGLALRVHGGHALHPDLFELYQEPLEPADVSPDDLACLLFTSGTTGRSKACMLPHRYFVVQAQIALRDLGWGPDDVLYCPFPLFHIDCTVFTVMPALLCGATAAVGRRFSASRFWAEVRAVDATVVEFMGATLTILAKAEPNADDRSHRVRQAWGVPVPDWAEAFEERFGVELREVYGSTEAGIPVTQRFDAERVPGSCGRVVPEFELRIADDSGQEQPAGSVGEILIRPREPWSMFSGYFGMPEDTAACWSNGWFHSGDLGRIDSDGDVYFCGRSKDAIRRRGENISAMEIEEAVELHPDIVLCAAIGVPSEMSEEDVKICVQLRPDAKLTERDIIAHCEQALGRFQVPRYVEIVEALPRTPTGKIAKQSLRQTPLSAATWDRESS